MINCLSLPAPLRGFLDAVSLTVIFQEHMALPHPISDAPAAPPALLTESQLSLGWGTPNTKTLAENFKVRKKLRETRSVENEILYLLPSVVLVSHSRGSQLPPEQGSLSKGTSLAAVLSESLVTMHFHKSNWNPLFPLPPHSGLPLGHMGLCLLILGQADTSGNVPSAHSPREQGTADFVTRHSMVRQCQGARCCKPIAA